MSASAEIKFRDRFTGRQVTGTLVRTEPNGTLIVRTLTKSARGGLWFDHLRPVKPSQVIR